MDRCPRERKCPANQCWQALRPNIARKAADRGSRLERERDGDKEARRETAECDITGREEEYCFSQTPFTPREVSSSSPSLEDLRRWARRETRAALLVVLLSCRSGWMALSCYASSVSDGPGETNCEAAIAFNLDDSRTIVIQNGRRGKKFKLRKSCTWRARSCVKRVTLRCCLSCDRAWLAGADFSWTKRFRTIFFHRRCSRAQMTSRKRTSDENEVMVSKEEKRRCVPTTW